VAEWSGLIGAEIIRRMERTTFIAAVKGGTGETSERALKAVTVQSRKC